MNSLLRCVLPPFLLFTASAYATDHKMTVGILHTAFTDDFGARSVVSAEYAAPVGPNTVVFKAQGGQRDYDNGDSFTDTSLSGTLYHHWNARFSTRTHISASSNEPVFVNRVVDQDVTYKGLPNTALTTGLKYSKYFGGVHARAWYVSGAYYFDRLTVRYRYTHNDLPSIGGSYGNLLTFRLKDPEGGGSTQLWLGQGTSVQEYDWSPIVQQGDFKSVALRRVQPITAALDVNLAVQQDWYETPVSDYEGFTSNVSLTYKW